MRIVRCLRSRFLTGVNVSWARRKKAPGIGPTAKLVDFTWDADNRRDGGFSVILRWVTDEGETVVGNHHDYATFMFERYKRILRTANLLSGNQPTPPIPKRYHVATDIQFFDPRLKSWVLFGQAIPSFLRRRLPDPKATAWIMSQEGSGSTSSMSPMLPTTPPLLSYTFGGKLAQSSKIFARVNAVLSAANSPSPQPKRKRRKKLSPLPSPTPPPSPTAHIPPLWLPPTVPEGIPEDVLTSPTNYVFDEADVLDDLLLTPLPPLPYDFLQSLN